MASAPATNRRDHYIPQGYLKGFIDPRRRDLPQPLWHFDKPNGTWSQRSPKEIGYRYGFYGYSVTEMGVETADAAFAELENMFPRVRKELVRKDFRPWKDYLDFFLRYVQMMRARSLLFFDEQQKDGRNLRALVVEEVSPDRMSVRVKSMTPQTLPDWFIKNRTITNMRAEISKGAAWLADFNWALRYTDSSSTPFVLTEQPLFAEGPGHENLADVIRDPETLLFFPLCWQAALIGSRQFFYREIDRFDDGDMRRFAEVSKSRSELFVVSPSRLDFSQAASRRRET
ncbi:MAG TPA: DUF4238 domain-containing protein [Candidatus Acidoferrales bacterium]